MHYFHTTCLIILAWGVIISGDKSNYDEYYYLGYDYDGDEPVKGGEKQQPDSKQRQPKPSIYANKVRWRVTSIANRVFALKLYAEVAKSHPEENILISPLVVSTGLSMILLGANGQTENELMSTLEYSNIGMKRNRRPYTKYDVPRLYESLLKRLNSSLEDGEDSFVIACRLFGEQTETFLPEFVRNTKKYYDAELELVDFAENCEAARQHINDWVSDKTEGTIEGALPEGTVSSATLLALASASYFKGTWQYQFDRADTRQGSFLLTNGSRINADFMRGRFNLQFRYSESLRSHTIILPYKTHRQDFEIEMQLFKPDDAEALAEIEEMSESELRGESRKMSYAPIELQLPKFKMEFCVDLAHSLQELGLRSLFGNADLSGMNGNMNLNFANAMHKGFIEVDEEGTTASASFVPVMTRNTMHSLVFDHPFFFLIREKTSNSILFMGRVARPE